MNSGASLVLEWGLAIFLVVMLLYLAIWFGLELWELYRDG